MASMVLPIKCWNPSRSLSFFHVLLRPSRVAPCIRCSAPSNSGFASISVKLFKWRLFIPVTSQFFLASPVFEGHGQLLVDYHKSKASSSKKKVTEGGSQHFFMVPVSCVTREFGHIITEERGSSFCGSHVVTRRMY